MKKSHKLLLGILAATMLSAPAFVGASRPLETKVATTQSTVISRRDYHSGLMQIVNDPNYKFHDRLDIWANDPNIAKVPPRAYTKEELAPRRFSITGVIDKIGPDVWLRGDGQYDEFVTYRVDTGKSHVWCLADGIGYPDLEKGKLVNFELIKKHPLDKFGFLKPEDKQKYNIKSPAVITSYTIQPLVQ